MSAAVQLVAKAYVHGEPVDEAFVSVGRSLIVGPGGDLDVPAPSGAPFLLEATWNGPHEVVVTDGRARLHRLGTLDRLDLHLGPVHVELSFVERFSLRRSAPFLLSASLPWAVVVVALSLLPAQGEIVAEHLCEWFGVACPVPPPPGSDGGAYVNAEYVARLLREDYAGDPQGGVKQDTPEQPVVMKTKEYVPAGQFDGDRTLLGGGAQVAEETVRGDDASTQRAKKRKPEAEPEPEVLPEVVLERPERVDDAVTEPTVGEAEGEDQGEDESAQGVTEKEEGWGLQDWLDASPAEREIMTGLQVARRRLAIDPDNTSALSMLAYFQYLGEDLEGAEKTYDRLIELRPEDAATWNNKALVLKRRGEYPREELLYRTALALDPEDTTAKMNLAVNLAHQGRFPEALAIMKALEVELPGDAYADLHRAKIHAEMGETDTALAFLGRAMEGMAQLDLLHHTEFRQDVRVDPSLDRIRDDPRFHAILQQHYGKDAPR